MSENKHKGIRKPPKPTKFEYPEGHKLEGEVKKEVHLQHKSDVDGEYCFVIQLVEHPGETKDHIRFGYYRRKRGSDKFRWASQTTYHAPVDITKELLVKAKKKGIL